MTYPINLHIFDIIGIILAVFILGMMAGQKFLPRPIDEKKEQLINQLFNENLSYKLQGLREAKKEQDRS